MIDCSCRIVDVVSVQILNPISRIYLVQSNAYVDFYGKRSPVVHIIHT